MFTPKSEVFWSGELEVKEKEQQVVEPLRDIIGGRVSKTKDIRSRHAELGLGRQGRVSSRRELVRLGKGKVGVPPVLRGI